VGALPLTSPFPISTLVKFANARSLASREGAHPVASLRAQGRGCQSARASASPLVGDSQEGPLKSQGESCLKPAKNAKHTSRLTQNMHTARPTRRWPPRPIRAAQQGAPSSEVRLARGLTPPSNEVRLARGSPPPSSRLPPRSRAHAPSSRLPPRSRVPASLERAPPPSRLPHEHTCSRTRVRAFNALTQQSRSITRLGITPRRCTANSLGGAHPHHCGELCDEAGVSPVTLCRPLLYG
jgi:hypothetical protein